MADVNNNKEQDADQAPPPALPSEPHWLIVWVRKNPKAVEALIYFAFLLVFTAVVVNAGGGGRQAHSYRLLANVKQRFEDPFLQVDSATAWFDYMTDTFIPLMYQNQWYNLDLFGIEELGWPGEGMPDNARLLGSVAVRQVRVRADSCSVHADLESLVPVCYGSYSSSTEDDSAFGPLSDGLPRYKYTSASQNGENSFRGQVATYSGAGFQVLLPSEARNTTLEQARTIIKQLRDNKWIDRQSRAVFVDFTLYNPAHELLLVVKLAAEFPGSGGVMTRQYSRVAQAQHLYPRALGVFHLIIEAIMLSMVLAYMGFETRLMFRMGASKYFSRFWGMYDWFNFILFWAAAGSRFQALTLAGGRAFPPDSAVFVNYEPPTYFIVQWKNLLAFNSFITWCKMFKYLQSLPFLAHLIKVVNATVPDVLAFLAAIFFVFFGFVLAHFLAYGDDIGRFSTLGDSMITLYRMLLGDFNVEEMEKSNRYLGPLFFVLWTLAATILFLNMFIAIVIDGFETVRQEVERVSFATFFKKQAVEPFQLAVNRLQKMMEGDEEEESDDEDKEIARGKQVLGKASAEELDGSTIPGFKVGDKDGTTENQQAEDEKMELVLQAVLTLSREVRVLSRRVKSLSDTANGPHNQPSIY